MIKVIRNGCEKVECGNCGSLLSYEHEDLEYISVRLENGAEYVRKVISCPVCNDLIVLNWKGE